MEDRPRLVRSGKTRWTVWIDGLGSTGTTPEEAMAKAGNVNDGRFCVQCVGTGTSRRWNGEGTEPACEACRGTGAPERPN